MKLRHFIGGRYRKQAVVVVVEVHGLKTGFCGFESHQLLDWQYLSLKEPCVFVQNNFAHDGA